MPATLADIQAKYGDSVYPLYKDEMHAPYMENDNGIGYRGVVLLDENEDKVQCSICGKWFKKLGGHTHFVHEMPLSEYKDIFGLCQNVPVCSKKFSSDQSKRSRSEENVKRMRGVGKKNGGVKIQKRSYSKTMQFKNKHGLCDAQIASRLVVVCKDSGKEMDQLSIGDLNKFDSNLLQSISEKYGSWLDAAKHFNFRVGSGYADAEIISKLRLFVREKKYIPLLEEFSKTVSVGENTIWRHFGSWNKAKMMAGLDQLLQEVK